MSCSLNPPDHLLYSTTLFLTVLHLLYFPVSSIDQQQQPISIPPQGMLMAGKSRLGSTPPSCYNRCNNCNPCRAVQVPAPNHDKVKTGLHRLDDASSMMKKKKNKEDDEKTDNSLPTSKDQYTNYKPLGWKCRCGNLLFNP